MKSRFDLLHKTLLSAYFFFVLTALAFFCGRIYTIFTHGETSKSLSSVWVFLLIFGTAFRILMAAVFTFLKRRPLQIASDIYDSGVITFTAGMTIKGLFEILGAERTLIQYYEFAGIGLMVIGFILIAALSQKLSEYSCETSMFDNFIAEKIVERVGARLEAKELYSIHNKWARGKGYYPLGKKKFIKELTSRYEFLHTGSIAEDYTVINVTIRS